MSEFWLKPYVFEREKPWPNIEDAQARMCLHLSESTSFVILSASSEAFPYGRNSILEFIGSIKT